jgi:hypothetical protein
MPTDGRARSIGATGVALNDFKRALREAAAGKKILIVDACREIPVGETRGSGAMSEKLRSALAASEGMAILASCGAGQLSWEAPDLNQGVYTHFLLQALRGSAQADPEDGLIRLGDVSSYAARLTKEWVRKFKNSEQEPWFEGEVARSIPLAISPEIQAQARAKTAGMEKEKAEFEKRKKEGLRLLVDAMLSDSETLGASLVDEVRKALENGPGPKTSEILEELEELKQNTPRTRKSFARFWAAESGGSFPGLSRLQEAELYLRNALKEAWSTELDGAELLSIEPTKKTSVTDEGLDDASKAEREEAVKNVMEVVAKIPKSDSEKLLKEILNLKGADRNKVLAFEVTLGEYMTKFGPKYIEGPKAEEFLKEASNTCLLNLRKVGLAMFMYAADNMDALPASYAQMGPYLKETTNFFCPSDPITFLINEQSTNPDPLTNSTYAIKAGSGKITPTREFASCFIHGHSVKTDGQADIGAKLTWKTPEEALKITSKYPGISHASICSMVLRTIDATKEQWALENKKAAGDLPEEKDLEPYFRDGFPKCIAGGKYSINPLQVMPACSMRGHRFAKFE